MVNKIEISRVVWDADVINVHEEGDISIDKNNVPVPDNFPVTDK